MWNKEGNYHKEVSYWDRDIKNECTYKIETEKCCVKKITLWKHSNGNERIVIEFKNKDIGKHFKSILRDSSILAHNFAYDSQIIECISKSKNDSQIIITKVIKIEPHTKMILDDLCTDLKISTSLVITIEELKNKLIPEAIKLAKEAQENNSYELIWQLSQIYYEDTLIENPIYKIDSNTLYSLLEDIQNKNPYYAKVQDLCVDLLMRIDVDDEEKQQSLELKFTHALLGTNQDLTDKLYEELCGYPSSNNYVKNIRGQADTLISLAKQMRNLTKKIQSLEEKQKNKVNNVTMFFEKNNNSSSQKNTNNDEITKKNYCGFKNGFLG